MAGESANGPREVPLLFSDDLVVRIRAGLKRVTRRPITSWRAGDLYLKGHGWIIGHDRTLDDAVEAGAATNKPRLWGFASRVEVPGREPFLYPFVTANAPASPGDTAWVREAWRPEERMSDRVDGVRFRADHLFVPIPNTAEAADRWVAVNDRSTRWRPSIHMPRWAARLLLPVVSVRAERLHQITPDDVALEGHPGQSPEFFFGRWDAIYGAGASFKNPWVWRVEFGTPTEAA